MAAGKYASLPRNIHISHPCSLASAMDLHNSGNPPIKQHSSPFQSISIHGTLPRKKNGKIPIVSHDMYNPRGPQAQLPPQPRLRNASVSYDIIEEHPAPQGKRQDFPSRNKHIVDFALEYVKFSKERYIMDSTPEKLKKELEEELKSSSEEPRSHAWYHGRVPGQVAENLIQRDGDFLIRDSFSSPGNFVLTCQWKNIPHHFKIKKVIVRLNEGYSRVQYQFERESFDSVPALVRSYVGNRKALTEHTGAIIFQPINRTLPLRCIEEKYGMSACVKQHQQVYSSDGKLDLAKRLSLNMSNGPSQERSLATGSLLRNKDKSGSQPASLDYVPDKRRPLKSHQSESYLPLGSKAQHQQLPQQHQKPCMEGNAHTKSTVFRTGSEPALSPTIVRRLTLETQAGEALRGSDSQLCPKPPPKPSKVPSMRMPNSPLLANDPERDNCFELMPNTPIDGPKTEQNGYVERLRTEEPVKPLFQKSESMLSMSEGSSFQSTIPVADENWKEEKETIVFLKPVFETVSCFKPNDFNSKMLPPDNKPLETSVIKHVKGLFANVDPKTIAKHILKVDSQVARILDVSEEMEAKMGVSSGLELITLSHGHQLRLDLIERHNTMAIGIAVDILGCTGSLEERAEVLNKFIQLALELKNSMGDLYAFSAVMKALDMPQVARLEQTWIALRHKYTQNAILYEKTLKPFIKALNEGKEEIPLSNTTVPLILPLITLIERPSVTFEGTELWENNDESCEIMLKHLENARSITQNAATHKANTEKILEDFQSDEEMLETFKTEFAMRLLWGSKGAQVNQTERYEKFIMILTALSRKLEPPIRH
uniref:Breast cancer anti-estrogen resistance protein 3 n=1 Tax=Callorhinchus milii TaxID=7868 RepID=V9KAW7_CALMI